jgi:hypothetical protein
MATSLIFENEDMMNIFIVYSPNKFMVIESRRMSWAEHVARFGWKTRRKETTHKT